MDGIDVVFHQAAIRITQCAEEPRLALEVLVDGTFNVLEAAVQRQGRRRWSRPRRRRCYGLAEDFPTTENAPSVQQPHDLRRGEGLQRRAAAQLQRDVRPAATSRCATSTSTDRAWTSTAPTPKCSSAGWSASRAAQPPLIFGDGTQTMDFVHVHDIARANILAAKRADVSDEVFNVASGQETSLKSWPKLLHGSWARSLDARVMRPERKVNPVPRRLADTSKAKRHARLRDRRCRSRRAWRRLVEWWKQERIATAA